MVSAVLRKSTTDLTRRKARAAFTVTALALAVASVGVFALPGLMDRQMQTEVAANRLADLTVATPPLALSDAQVAQLASLPNVAALAPRSYFLTRIYVGDRRAKAILIGIPDFSHQQADIVAVTAGTAPGRGEVVTELQNAGHSFGGARGEVVRVIAADGSVQRLPITGTGRSLTGGQDVIGEGLVVLYASSQTVGTLRGEPGYEALAFRLRDTGSGAVAATIADIERTLQAEAAFTGFTALPAVRAPGDWPGKAELDNFSQLFEIVTLLALISAVVLVANTMTTLVGEQTAEIAAMKAIGGGRRDIAAIYVRTALLLGVLGTAVGLALGLALANGLVRYFGSTFFGIDAGLGIDVPVLAVSVVVGLLGPVVAALPAIRRAMRVTVHAGLAGSGETPGAAGAVDRLLRGVHGLPRSVQIGLRSVGRRKRRSFSTVLQVGVAVATVLALLGLSSGVADTVHGAWRDHGWQLWVSATGRPFDTTAAGIVAATPGVAGVEPMVGDEIQLRGRDAFIWATSANTSLGYRIGAGRWFTAAEDRAASRVAVIERNLARATGTAVGDTITVATAVGPVDLQVVGVSDNQQETGTVVFVPLTTWRALEHRGTTSSAFWVRTDSTDHGSVDRTATRVEDALVARGYGVGTEVTYAAERADAAKYRTLTTTITVLGFVIIAIGLVGLVNSMTMSVLERTREVGLLRCVGAHARDIRRIFASEGIVLVLAGSVVGIPLGYVLLRGILWLMREQLNVDVAVSYPASNIPLVLAGTLALTLVVMLAPLRRATRLRPGAALRYL
jgi:putative ABC transport system permease protein